MSSGGGVIMGDVTRRGLGLQSPPVKDKVSVVPAHGCQEAAVLLVWIPQSHRASAIPQGSAVHGWSGLAGWGRVCGMGRLAKHGCQALGTSQVEAQELVRGRAAGRTHGHGCQQDQGREPCRGRPEEAQNPVCRDWLVRF